MTEQYPPISVVMIPEGHIFHAPLYPWGSANDSQGWIHPEGADCGVCHLLKRSPVESPEDALSRLNAKAMETEKGLRWEDDLPAVHRRLASETERANKMEKTIHRILDFIQDKD